MVVAAKSGYKAAIVIVCHEDAGIHDLDVSKLHYLFSTLSGGFSLTFAGLILWYVFNLSFLSLLSKLTATSVVIKSHFGIKPFGSSF